MNLFEEYTYNPYYSKNGIFLDDVLDYKDYKDIYNDLTDRFNVINQKIKTLYFSCDYNYFEKDFTLITTQRFISNLFFKMLTLQKIKDKHNNEEIVLDVYTEELDFYKEGYNGFSPNRFSNHYVWLAKSIGKPFIINNLGDKNIVYEHETKSKNIILRILNSDFGFLWNEFKNRILKVKYKKNILQIKDNSIIREIRTQLNNADIGVLDIGNDLEKLYYSEKYHQNILDVNIYDAILSIIKSELSDLEDVYKLENTFIKSYISIISEMTTYYIKHLLLVKNDMRDLVKKHKEDIEYNICITNGLFGGYGISLADAFIYNNIKIISAEHGLTIGNNLDSHEAFDSNESKTSNTVLCYTKASKSTFELSENNNSEKIIVGSPKETKELKFKGLQKLINKNKFKTKSTTIFYVSHSIELNSGKYFPNTKSNPKIFKDEINLLNYLGKVNKDVVFKLYPTKQYFEDKVEFIKEVENRYSNLQLINSEEDFRYMRSIADIVITQSSESTLGWCIGLNVPLVFLDSDYYEPLADENVKKAFRESFFVFNYDKDGWEQELIDFLNKPYSEILKSWKNKEKYRIKYDDVYFLSSKKDAGKLGAEYVKKCIEV